MRKMIVITRDGNRSEEIGDLLDLDERNQTETTTSASEIDDDREIDTLLWTWNLYSRKTNPSGKLLMDCGRIIRLLQS